MVLSENLQKKLVEDKRKSIPQLFVVLVEDSSSLCVLWKWLSLIFLKEQFTHVSNSMLNRANALSSKCVLIMYLTICK